MVFDLKHFQGMKLRAVREILNISESSVKTSLLRATQKLRLQLARYTKLQKSSMKWFCNQRDVSQTAIPKREKEFMATAPIRNLERPNGLSMPIMVGTISGLPNLRRKPNATYKFLEARVGA